MFNWCAWLEFVTDVYPKLNMADRAKNVIWLAEFLLFRNYSVVWKLMWCELSWYGYYRKLKKNKFRKHNLNLAHTVHCTWIIIGRSFAKNILCWTEVQYGCYHRKIVAYWKMKNPFLRNFKLEWTQIVHEWSMNSPS